MRKKQKITVEEYHSMMDKIMPYMRDSDKLGTQMQQLEETLAEHTYLEPNAQLLILRGSVLHNAGKTKEAESTYDKAALLAQSSHQPAWQAEALRLKGAMQNYSGRQIEAEQTLKTALELFIMLDAKYNIAACLHSLSLIYNETGEFEKYIETSEEALHMLKNSGAGDDVYARAYVLTIATRAGVLRRMHLYDHTAKLLNELMTSKEYELAGDFARNNALMEYGMYLSDEKKYEKSNEALFKYLDNVKGQAVDLSMAVVYATISQNMIELGQHKEGEKYINFSILYNRQNNDMFYLAENLLVLALHLSGQHKKKQAEACLKEAETLAAGMNTDYYLWKFNENIAYYFEKQKDHEKAYRHLQIAKKHEAICLRADYDKKIKSINERQLLIEKEKQNQLLQKDIDMKKQELSMASDFLHQKVELLKELQGFMNNMRKENIQKNELIKAMNTKISSAINVEYEQQVFMEKIEVSSNEFITKLRNKYPVLTMTEAKVCSLLRNNFSNKEIANLLVMSIRTVEGHRLRIRKKLDVSGDSTLTKLLTEIA